MESTEHRFSIYNSMFISEKLTLQHLICQPCHRVMAKDKVRCDLHFLTFYLQMFEAEEDGAITEMELAVILKTALGVANLSVSHLFTAIDAEDTGKITFGKNPNKFK